MTPEEIFSTYFLPLYPADLARDLGALGRARFADANPAGNPAFRAHLDEAAARFVSNARALFDADLQLDGSDASVHRLAAALTRDRREAWAASGAPAGKPGNVLFNVAVHGAAYVGSCIVRHHGGIWGIRRPLWESVVRLESRAGEGDLAVFHWWLKSLSDDALALGRDAGPLREASPSRATLADRYRMHVEVPCTNPQGFPVLVPEGRVLPRLKQPTYDSVHKYLRAHLPEFRDLGEDFPSAARFATFALRWLDFHVVGAGRALLLSGASKDGLHLFWLGARGFERSAFLMGESVPEPIVRMRGDRIIVMTTLGGEPQTHEMFWWGL